MISLTRSANPARLKNNFGPSGSWGKELKNVPGDPALNLAASCRSSSKIVVGADGVRERFKPYTGNVRRYLDDYRPR